MGLTCFCKWIKDGLSVGSVVLFLISITFFVMGYLMSNSVICWISAAFMILFCVAFFVSIMCCHCKREEERETTPLTHKAKEIELIINV